MSGEFRDIEIGDFAPLTAFRDQTGKGESLFSQYLAGRPIALCVYHGPSSKAARARLAALQDRAADFEAAGAKIVAVSTASPEDHAKFAGEIGAEFTFLSDPAGEFAASFGLDPSPKSTFLGVLDCNARLLRTFTGSSDEETVSAMVEACQAEAAASADGEVWTQAPVLQIPRLFEPAFCKKLIDYWDSNDKRENEIRHGDDKQQVAISSDRVKRRTDVLVPQDDGALNQGIAQRLSLRLVPEVAKAFQFNVSSYDVARIVCYDAENQGFFAAHRDEYGYDENTRRRFAVSINLNGDYQGGVIRFPEYGRQTYNPPPGGAAVFSCNLLHEVLPVTEGRRFGVILFLY